MLQINKRKIPRTASIRKASVCALLFMLILFSGCSDTATDQANIDSGTAVAAEKSDSTTYGSLSRIFWQDKDNGLIKAADIVSSKDGLNIQEHKIKGLDSIDVDNQDFVQMVIEDGNLVVGVRDRADGENSSGWLTIDSGVEEESHGDHSHWHYDEVPKLHSSTLDNKQGNPAHVYHYDRRVYVANDKNSGFTMIDFSDGKPVAKFFKGGGGHITLAAVGGKIAYSTWIDRKGENAGRVDVVNLRSDGTEPKYSFNLPSGGIHGATACGNRVFFAPSDGVCWVDCDFDFVKDADAVSVQHLSLGEFEGTPYRTGAFCSFRNHVLCIANCKGAPPALCLIDGTTPEPGVIRFVCDDLDEGLKIGTVKAVAVNGHPYAVAFAEGSGVQEKLLVFDLDTNKDRKMGDLELVNSIDVGKSQIVGHFGHHGIDFLEGQNLAVLTNPGDGTISFLDLQNWKIKETIKVNGQPTHVIAYGSLQ